MNAPYTPSADEVMFDYVTRRRIEDQVKGIEPLSGDEYADEFDRWLARTIAKAREIRA